MKKSIYLALATAALSCTPNPSYALGTLSRACEFSSIPPGAQTIAARFFKMVGADDSVLDLPNKSLTEQKYWWTLEALTLDWGQVRYYLFAAAKVYYNTGIDSYTGWYYYKPYTDSSEKYVEYKSAWTAQQISDAMRADPNFSPYYANREWLYSARAGDPRIVVYNNWLAWPGAFYVLGKHFYYDATLNVRTQLADTTATSCNIQNLGNLSSFGDGLFDR